jgi:transcriptional pleiotropic regulator of transition state genes
MDMIRIIKEKGINMDTGIVRNLNSVGQVFIPQETRDILSIHVKDSLEIFTGEEAGKPVIILKKYYPGCVFCNAVDDCIRFKGKFVCRKCIDEI